MFSSQVQDIITAVTRSGPRTENKRLTLSHMLNDKGLVKDQYRMIKTFTCLCIELTFEEERANISQVRDRRHRQSSCTVITTSAYTYVSQWSSKQVTSALSPPPQLPSRRKEKKRDHTIKRHLQHQSKCPPHTPAKTNPANAKLSRQQTSPKSSSTFAASITLTM